MYWVMDNLYSVRRQVLSLDQSDMDESSFHIIDEERAIVSTNSAKEKTKQKCAIINYFK
jgi:hypothetical protein